MNVIYTLGFIKLIHPYPHWLDDIKLTNANFGIDEFRTKPLIVRQSESLDLSKIPIDDQLLKSMNLLVQIIVRYMEYNQISDDIILQYKLALDGWDVRILCAAYKAII